MFHVGQRVVCVDTAPTYLGKPVPLRKGAIYTICAVGRPDFYDVYGLYLAEVAAPEDGKHLDAFRHTRFRPVLSRKTDIGIFKGMLLPNGVRELMIVS